MPRHSQGFCWRCEVRGLDLADMVLKGSLLGPPLSNMFYEDALGEIDELSYTWIVYADDINGFWIFRSAAPSNDIMSGLVICQKELQDCGGASKIEVDAKKKAYPHSRGPMHTAPDLSPWEQY